MSAFSTRLQPRKKFKSKHGSSIDVRSRASGGGGTKGKTALAPNCVCRIGFQPYRIFFHSHDAALAEIVSLPELYGARLDVLLAEEEPVPDLPCLHKGPNAAHMQLAAIPGKGQGWRAEADMEAGTTLLVEKPFAAVYDWQTARCESEASPSQPISY